MKRQFKPLVTMAVAVSFLLAACGGSTGTTGSGTSGSGTTGTGSTAVATTDTSGTGSSGATVESTSDASTGGTTGTDAAGTGTPSASGTDMMTGTSTAGMDTTGTPEAMSTDMMTGTSTAGMDTTGTPEAMSTDMMTGTSTAGMDTTGTPEAMSTDAMTSTEMMTGTGMMTDTEMMTGSMATTATMDIVDTAIATGQFMSLTAALESAGLVETLQGDGPYTVFAPTDEAFAKLDSDTIDMLMDPANQDELVKILTYHVVSGTVMAADVAGMSTADTLEGSPITITVSGGEVMINDATIVMTDVVASNGVIHVIDTVLMPPDAKTP